MSVHIAELVLLREESGCGMAQCKEAMERTYTYEQAKRYLQLKGIALYVRSGPAPLEKFLAQIDLEAKDG